MNRETSFAFRRRNATGKTGCVAAHAIFASDGTLFEASRGDARTSVLVLHHGPTSDGGDPERGLAELTTIDEQTASPASRALLPLYDATLRLEAGKVTPSTAATVRATAARVGALLPSLELEDDCRRALVRQASLVDVAFSRLLGDSDGALASLRTLVTGNPLDAHAWSLLHDLYAGRGQQELAEDARQRALAGAPAGGRTARRLGGSSHPFR